MDNAQISSALRSLREGDFNVRLPENDPASADAAREYNLLLEHLSEIKAEFDRICREIGSEGRFGGQAEIEGVNGAWREMVDGLNDASRSLTIQIRAASQVLAAKARGEVDTILTLPASGETKELFDIINGVGREPQPAAV